MSKIKLTGSNSGYVEIDSAADAGNLTLSLPTSGTRLLSNTDNVFSGITTTGQLDINGSIDVSSTSVFNDDVTFTGGSYNVLWDKSDNQLEFGDNAKLSFGGQADLQLYHDSNHSYIKNVTNDLLIQNTGDDVYIDAADDIFIRTSNNEDAVKCIGDGAVELYFNSSKKIETTNTGAVVTGICTATSFSGDGEGLTRTTQLSHRNIIINGDFRIAQRATSSTSSGIHSVDRFGVWHDNTDEAPTQSQVNVSSGTTPYTLGFRRALKVTNGNQTSGAGVGDYIWIQNNLEAQDIANSGWNYTSSSSFITLQFWVKSSVAQDFKCYLRSRDGSQMMYPFNTGTLTANTWTKVTKTIPGNSGLTFDNDVNQGFQINIGCFFGDNLTSAATNENAWTSWNSSMRTKVFTPTWYTTNDAIFEVTGVQLEVGSVATPFEHRSYGEELQRCKRYFQFVPPTLGEAQHSTNIQGCLTASPPMRAAPTCAIKVTSNNINLAGAGPKTCTSVGTLYYNSTQGGWTEMGGSSFSQYRNYYILPNCFTFTSEV